MTNRKIEYWVIPPETDAEFVAHMEGVLDVYAQPYDPTRPTLCMDEQPVQFQRESRPPLPATAQHGKRIDYEYERAGTASIFMFTEPLAGWRKVSVRERRTKVDWAIEVAHILEERYADCEKVQLVCDNLNTHTKGAFYEAFPAQKAFKLAQNFEFHFTPVKASWLNMVEIELSVLARQCLNRRIPTIEILTSEIKQLVKERNEVSATINWQFSISIAREKLRKHYFKNI